MNKLLCLISVFLLPFYGMAQCTDNESCMDAQMITIPLLDTYTWQLDCNNLEVLSFVDCNTGANAGSGGNNLTYINCGEFGSGTVWYEFTIDAGTSYYYDFKIESSDITDPLIAIWAYEDEGNATDCETNKYGLFCKASSSGEAIIKEVVLSGSSTTNTYLISIASQSGMEGDFTFCARSYEPNQPCTLSANLYYGDGTGTATPHPDPSVFFDSNGGYIPGIPIEFCYEIDTFSQAYSNWLHGIVPNFGDGWDLSTLTSTMEPTYDGATEAGWQWTEGGIAKSWNTGETIMDAGWWFYGTFITSCSLPETHPSSRWGTPKSPGPWQACFQLFTPSYDCSGKYNMYVGVNSYGDNETGGWGCPGQNPNFGCAIDLPVVLPGMMDLEPYTDCPEFSLIKGTVFYDENQNGVFDVNEFALKNHKVEVNPVALTTFTDDNGGFIHYVNPGTHTLAYQAPEDWLLTTSSSIEVTLGEGEISSGNDFGIFPENIITDYQPYISAGPIRCNFIGNFFLDVVNEGTTINNGYIKFEIDPSVTYISADVQPDSMDTETNTYIWGFENLLPTEEKNVNIKLKMPGIEFVNEELSFTAMSYFENDDLDFVYNNDDVYTRVLTCSYDPNDKLVQPQGAGEENYTLKDEELLYTIRFQNTGNDTAFNVQITDQLDTNLDWSTFRPITGSHDFTTYLDNNTGMVEFNFDNILLPDHIVDEPGSHGFVKYGIKANGGLSDFTVVQNTANIYFDFNPAIVTNTTTNTLVSLANYPLPIIAKTYLEGTYDMETGLMTTHLRDADLLPLSQPFNQAPWNYTGNEKVNNISDIPPDIVDWVMVELRSADDPEIIIAQKAGFLRSNSYIMDVEGSEQITFKGVHPDNEYYVLIRTRNHLDLISAEAKSPYSKFDFTRANQVSGDTSQLRDLGNGSYAMIVGDYNGDGVISVDDYNLYLINAALLNQYLSSDGNMDKAVTVTDYNIYKSNASIIGVNVVRY